MFVLWLFRLAWLLVVLAYLRSSFRLWRDAKSESRKQFNSRCVDSLIGLLWFAPVIAVGAFALFEDIFSVAVGLWFLWLIPIGALFVWACNLRNAKFQPKHSDDLPTESE